jgi:N-methylhydantoinase A
LPNYSLGIDIGGTFTDIVVHDHDAGRQWSKKVLTTHDDPARAVGAGVVALLEAARIDPSRVTRVVHATTLFTNALIERTGARTGLITTAGFADTLEIGRERKFELYDLNIAKPEPLTPRDLRLEVNERTKADGSVRQPLDPIELAVRLRRLRRSGVTSIAVVFLHAYANPRHEIEAIRLISLRHPEIATTASHEVAPEIREYERASTTAVNAYIKPLAQKYLAVMAGQLAWLGIPAPLLLMLSSGGLTHVAEAQRAPVTMLESGPAAGAIAAAFFGEADSGGNLLALEMGGTTAKLSIVDDGEPLTTYSFEAARQRRFVEGSGLPIRISTIELIEIGAGGGSIAEVNEIGLLKVGPRSAGSQPGPAAYASGERTPRSRTPTSCSAISTPITSRGARCASTSRPPRPPSSGWRAGWACPPRRSRGGSTTSSTRPWRARRACTSPSGDATPATARCSPRVARARCTPGPSRRSSASPA